MNTEFFIEIGASLFALEVGRWGLGVYKNRLPRAITREIIERFKKNQDAQHQRWVEELARIREERHELLLAKKARLIEKENNERARQD